MRSMMDNTVKIDFKNTNGKINPLHGVNSGPMTKVFTYDAREHFRMAGFPYARLHDVEYPYGSGEFVDVHCIFKKFDADENDPASYSFGLTDKYLEAILETGCKPFYRLGNSIEGQSLPIKRHVLPPKDYLKWAKICEHIIMHYNEGWANGYHWNLEYFEIWNEPDLDSKSNWYGPNEEFYKFYDVAATYLKSRFPHLKIGGPAFSGPRGAFQEEFFTYITTRDHKVPLDFCSWHRYAVDMDKLLSGAESMKDTLERYGYADAESILNEWNYMADWQNQSESYRILKGHKGGAHAAAFLCTLQSETNVKIANYFEADVVKEWCGIFDVDEMSIGAHGRKASLKPLKAFHAFRSFNELYKLGEAVEITSGISKAIKVAAARNPEKCALLAANYDGEDTSVTFDLTNLADRELEIRLVDETHNFERIAICKTNGSDMKITLPMKKDSFVYIGSRLN